MKTKTIIITILFACLLLKSESTFACATCFGAEGNPQTEGLNMAIITLLGVTYSLFTGMGLMALYCWKKNQKNNKNESDELGVSLSEEATINHG
jgi:hypothetical protein